MGGSITGDGNVNASAEANIANDPEAAQIVFQAGWPLTMVGLDVGDQNSADPEAHRTAEEESGADERFHLQGGGIF